MRKKSSNPATATILAILFVVIGLFVAYFTANPRSPYWAGSLHTAAWILIGSALLSAISASIALSIRLTWYSALLTVLCILSAGGLGLFAVSLGFP